MLRVNMQFKYFDLRVTNVDNNARVHLHLIPFPLTDFGHVHTMISNVRLMFD